MSGFQSSTKIDAFFVEEGQKDGFWDALRENEQMLPDYEYWSEDEHYDDFNEGFDLANKARDLGKPIFCHSDYTDYCSNHFYYIGTEDEILVRLREGWVAFQKKYPAKTKEEKLATANKRQIEKLEQEKARIELQLKGLKSN